MRKGDQSAYNEATTWVIFVVVLALAAIIFVALKTNTLELANTRVIPGINGIV